MGLALAIDYTLLIVSRYRDELADGAERDEALVRTMATAGRTVLFSALTVALSMVAMVLFPMYFLKSLAYAGVAVVAFAAIAAVVVAPAAIVLLGDRLDALDMRRLSRRVLGGPNRSASRSSRPSGTAARNSLCAGRFRSASRSSRCCSCSARRSSASSGASPTTACCRNRCRLAQVGDHLRNNFAVDSARNVTVVIPDTAGITPTEIDRYAGDAVPGARRVVGVGARRDIRDGRPVGPPSRRTGIKDGSAFFTVGSTRAAVLRRLRGPTGPVARGEPPAAARRCN